MGSEIVIFGSHCSANFQPILDCFILNFKLEYDNLENIKTDCVNVVVFNLHQIKRLKFLFGTPGTLNRRCSYSEVTSLNCFLSLSCLESLCFSATFREIHLPSSGKVCVCVWYICFAEDQNILTLFWTRGGGGGGI